MRRQLGLFSALTIALAVAPARADVLVVAPSGTPFPQVQTAIDVAADGDVVLVRAGTYESFVVRNKEVAIVADAGAVVQIQGSVRVSGLAATRSVVLIGLRATGSQTPQNSTRHGLYVRHCEGPVRVLGCQFRGTTTELLLPSTCYEGQGAWIEFCADVTITDTSLSGSTWHGSFSGYVDGGHGIYADSSTLTLYDDTLVGGRGGYGYGYTMGCAPLPSPDSGSYFGAAGEGMRSQGGFCFASNTTFTGADGWNGACYSGPFCECASKGGNGLVSNSGASSEILLACSTLPGVGGTPATGSCCGIGCYCCSAGSCPGFPVNPTACPAGPDPSFAIVGNVTQLSGSPRRLHATRVVREGQTVTLTLSGSPGDRVELAFSDETARRYQAGWRGVWTIARRGPQLYLQAGTIGPSGTLALTWPVGDLGTGVPSRLVFTQALMTSTTGETTFSSPATIVLLDAAF